MIRAALEDARPGGAPPCQSADGLWFGSVGSPGWNRFYGQTAAPETWKGCLQTLAAGDSYRRQSSAWRFGTASRGQSHSRKHSCRL